MNASIKQTQPQVHPQQAKLLVEYVLLVEATPTQTNYGNAALRSIVLSVHISSF